MRGGSYPDRLRPYTRLGAGDPGGEGLNLSWPATAAYAKLGGSSQWWLISISFCRILSSVLPDVEIMSARGIAKKRQKNVSKSQRANVLFPVGRLHRYMKAGPGTRRLRIGVGAPVYAAAVIEYLTGGAWGGASPLPWACTVRNMSLLLIMYFATATTTTACHCH